MEYDYKKGKEDIEKILNNNAQIENKEVPKNDDDFTYDNGVKSFIGSIFIDLVDSTKLIKDNSENEIITSKILRSFTSEAITILNSLDSVREIGIRGDCVYGIYNTPDKDDIFDLFLISAYLNTLIKMLNKMYSKKDYPSIKAGIGVGVGKDLIIKAGKKGTGINDKIWIGASVVDACKLANVANRDGFGNIGYNKMAYINFIDSLKKAKGEEALEWFKYNSEFNAYFGDIIVEPFNNWIENEL